MTIATVNDIAAGLAVAQIIGVQKTGTTPKASGSYQSAWLAAGRPGAGASSPAYTSGSGYTCSSATAGAMAYVNAAIQNYLAKMYFSGSQAGTLFLVDRLWSCSGMGFAAGTYAVTTPGALPARITDSGLSVWAAVEQFVAAGAASGTLTLNYLNTAAQAKAGVIAAVVSAPVAGQIQPIPWQTGDVGISQVTNVVTSATWTSGSFGISLFKTIAELTIDFAGGGKSLDWALLGLPIILPNACLMLIQLAAGASGVNVLGSLAIIDK